MLITSLIRFVICMLFSGLMISFSYGAEEKDQFSEWRKERLQLNKERDQYLKDNSVGRDWFENTPVGISGIPIIIYQLFPDMFPDLWTLKNINALGIEMNPDTKLGYGFGQSLGSKPLLGFLSDESRLTVHQATCKACHNNWVKEENEKGQFNYIELLGAPSTRMDIHGYRRLVYKTVTHKDFTFEKLMEALDAADEKAKKEDKNSEGKIFIKDPEFKGWWPRLIFRNREYAERMALRNFGRQIMAGLKKKVMITEELLHLLLKKHSGYDEGGLDGDEPGTLEPFGIGAVGAYETEFVSYVKEHYDYDDMSVKEIMGKFDEFITKTGKRPANYFQKAPALVGIPSVYFQELQAAGQWDANIPDPTIRNLLAAFGVMRGHKIVNPQTAIETQKFVAKLPPKPYIFDVHAEKRKRGKEVYKKACMGCHGDPDSKEIAKLKFLPIEEIGTDPNRATGLTAEARIDLIKAVVRICKHWKIEKSLGVRNCNDLNDDENDSNDDNRVIIARQNNPGYISPLLKGIWTRAPYGHNDVWPTMYHVLVPSDRPSSFIKGDRAFDQINLGFEWKIGKAKGFEFVIDNGNGKGKSNEGHDFVGRSESFYQYYNFEYIDFKTNIKARVDLLEYLKTI